MMIWQRYINPELKIKEQTLLQLEPELIIKTHNFVLSAALMQIVDLDAKLESDTWEA
ncbi:MAG: hypothetical protein ACTSQP_17700 [Promethearchaeota archaeon]